MSDETLEPLSPDLAALVGAERRRADPPAVVAQRLHQRLVASAASGAAALPVAGATGKAAAIKLALVFGVGLGAGVALTLALRPPPVETVKVVYVEAPVVAPEVPVQAAPDPVPVPPPAAPHPAVVPRPKPPANLDAERQLLEAARAALARGSPDVALGHLRQHEAKHPAGAFVEERDPKNRKPPGLSA